MGKIPSTLGYDSASEWHKSLSAEDRDALDSVLLAGYATLQEVYEVVRAIERAHSSAELETAMAAILRDTQPAENGSS